MTRAVSFAALFALSMSPAFAQQQCTPIHFPAGQSSAVVTGFVSSDEPFPCYSFAAGQGQTATMKFTRTNRNMAFTIYDLVDDRDTYTFKTDVKTYRFIVFQTLRAASAPFALSIAIK